MAWPAPADITRLARSVPTIYLEVVMEILVFEIDCEDVLCGDCEFLRAFHSECAIFCGLDSAEDEDGDEQYIRHNECIEKTSRPPAQECADCDGTGMDRGDGCTMCDGAGRV